MVEEFRKTWVEKAIPDLRTVMGVKYAEAALACLDGLLEDFLSRAPGSL
jgi:hypothetical protein